MEPYKSIGIIECNLSELPCILKKIKRQEKEGTLSQDGNVIIRTKNEAKKMIEEAEKNAPDCSTFGYTMAIINSIDDAVGPKIKSKILSYGNKNLGNRARLDFGLLLGFSPEDLVLKKANEFIMKQLPLKRIGNSSRVGAFTMGKVPTRLAPILFF